MVTLDAARWLAIPGMAALLDALGAGEGLTRYVGGAVRDDLLGLAVNDLDLATRLRPEEVMDRLAAASIKAIPTGIEHGTVTAVSDGQTFEITTLRRDVSTDGRRATVAFTDDWKEDASRRDFTINALSADPVSGALFDYFGGLEDLQAGRVRFIGEPLQRIAEDHLRILRFFRFHARFGRGEADPKGLQACAARSNDLMALSRERIADELLKLLALPNPEPTVRLMLDHGILAPVLPEIEQSRLEQFERLISAEQSAGVAPDPLRRLSALLPSEADVSERVAARLRLSNKARKRLACVAEGDPQGNARSLAYRLGTECAVDILLLAGRSEEAGATLQWTVPRLPIGGGALIALGISAGPEVARTLRRIEERWIAEDFPSGSTFEQIVETTLEERRG